MAANYDTSVSVVARSESARWDPILAEVAQLPDSWHSAGTLSDAALRALATHAGANRVEHSIETGTGKSTLLLSHLSADHKVFTIAGDRDSSYSSVLASPLLDREAAEFVIGPTQETLPRYSFANQLHICLLDGPHAYPFPDLEYYYVYPNIAPNGLLVIDDIHIPTIFNLFTFLKEDAMFRLLEVVGTTAFFKRTDAPVFPRSEDNWWTQGYNIGRFPMSRWPEWGGWRPRIRNLVPISVRRRLKGLIPIGARKWLIRS